MYRIVFLIPLQLLIQCLYYIQMTHHLCLRLCYRDLLESVERRELLETREKEA